MQDRAGRRRKTEGKIKTVHGLQFIADS